MNLFIKRLRWLLAIFIIIPIIPFIRIYQGVITAWKSSHMLRYIKKDYAGLFKETKEFWKYDFDVDKINEDRKQEKLDRLFRNGK